VFSTSQTAVAFGIKGVTIGKSPLCSARPFGEATHVINDDWKSRWNIGGAGVRRNWPFAADISGLLKCLAGFNCIWNRESIANAVYGTTPFTALAKAS
jgi:hypothetical protein